jgi:hypothetical protein
MQEVAKRRAGGSVKADFAQFPSNEMTKVRCCVRSPRHTSFSQTISFKRNLIVMEQYILYCVGYSVGVSL